MSLSPCLQKAIGGFPAQGQQQLASILSAPGFRGVISPSDFAALGKTCGVTPTQLAQLLVPVATCYARPPISQFTVGVVALGITTNAAYFGANMEFPGAALSFTVHAEQSATTNAWMNGEGGLASIAISAAPCGYCRQFLYELTTADQLLVLLDKQPAIPLTTLLPQAFGPHDLDVNAALMTPQNHRLVLSDRSTDPVVVAALAAANASYAPYSFAYAGVAVQTAGNQVFTGRLAENAAFNPAMSPLEGALTMRSLSATPDDPVTRVVLVEAQPVGNGIPSQVSATRAIVDTYGGVVSFDVHAAIPG